MTLMTTFERWQNKVVAKCDSLGGRQKTTIINESGLYSLILSSKLPMAREFKWAQWKFSGDKHKSAHPINLGDSQDLPGRQYTSALPM